MVRFVLVVSVDGVTRISTNEIMATRMSNRQDSHIVERDGDERMVSKQRVKDAVSMIDAMLPVRSAVEKLMGLKSRIGKEPLMWPASVPFTT